MNGVLFIKRFRVGKKFKVVADFIYGSIPLAIKYGSVYRKYKRSLKRTQWMSRAELEQLQLRKLKQLLEYAYQNIEFYRKEFDRIGFIPNSIESLKDLEKLPIIDKEVMIKCQNELISKEFKNKQLDYMTTGGTSGRQFGIYIERRSYPKREIPFVDSIWGRVGYIRNKSRIAQLRNQVLEEGRLWEKNRRNHFLVLDSYHLTDKNIGTLLQVLKVKQIEYLHTYPSSALILCDYIKRKGIDFTGSLKAALVSSENIYPGQKETIEKYLKCRCFTFYGHTECAALAGWCEVSDKYHIQSEYGYLELVDNVGNVITEPNVIGEIVCTGFDHFAMPFIRYRTGDYSSYSKEQDCQCGRHYKLLNEIKGRWTQEMFICKDYNRIPMTAINMHSNIFKNVINYQFQQDKPGECILRIVKNEFYLDTEEKIILQELGKKFDNLMQIKIVYVSDIDRTTRGKQQFIIQNIKD